MNYGKLRPWQVSTFSFNAKINWWEKENYVKRRQSKLVNWKKTLPCIFFSTHKVHVIFSTLAAFHPAVQLCIEAIRKWLAAFKESFVFFPVTCVHVLNFLWVLIGRVFWAVIWQLEETKLLFSLHVSCLHNVVAQPSRIDTSRLLISQTLRRSLPISSTNFFATSERTYSISYFSSPFQVFSP